MMKALEKAAKALRDWSERSEDRTFPPYEQYRDEWNDGARAVLMAIREPDGGMLDAYTDACDELDGPAAMHLRPDAFAAMIDAMLSEEPTEPTLTRAEAVQAIRDGKIERYCVPGQWRTVMVHGVPIVEELG